MTAPFEKAKLLGYDVQFANEIGRPLSFLIVTPDGEEIEGPHGPLTWADEESAWIAADHHRMYGTVYAHTPERCPSGHHNDGADVCADCGEDLNPAPPSKVIIHAVVEDTFGYTPTEPAADSPLRSGRRITIAERQWRVTWEIDVVAPDPVEAAREARRFQRDDRRTGVFDCHTEGQESVRVDLDHEAENTELVTPLEPVTVYIVQGDHWAVPGRPMWAFRTKAGADAKAAALVNSFAAELGGEDGMLESAAIAADATPETWPLVLGTLQNAYAKEFGDPDVDDSTSESEFHVWIQETEFFA